MRPLHLILHQRKQDKEIKPPTVAAKLHSWRQSFYSISNFGNVLLVIVYRIKSHREVMKLLLKLPRTRKGRNLVSEEKWDKRKFFLRQFWFKIDSISTISRLSKALNPPNSFHSELAFTSISIIIIFTMCEVHIDLPLLLCHDSHLQSHLIPMSSSGGECPLSYDLNNGCHTLHAYRTDPSQCLNTQQSLFFYSLAGRYANSFTMKHFIFWFHKKAALSSQTLVVEKVFTHKSKSTRWSRPNTERTENTENILD